MRLSAKLATLALAASSASAKYCDPDLSDLCFEESTTDSNVTYRLAIPVDAPDGFRAALQIVAPIDMGWAGFAWGGNMIGMPLTMGWKNGQDVTVSPRKAT